MSTPRQAYPADVVPPTADALSNLMGRESQVETVVADLLRARLVTLTGPGGVGKSRLALAVVAAAELESMGSFGIAALGDVSDEGLVVPMLTAALGLDDVTDLASVADLGARLGDQRRLLVVDGCERLRATCAAAVATLLQAAPGVRVLATGLQPLGLAGEHIWPVPPLIAPLPGASAVEVGQASAVQLFVARLQAQQPDFRLSESNASVVGTLCWGLDGLPLALELAASRAALLGLDQVARLVGEDLRVLTAHERGAAGRPQSLSSTLDRGWGLLDAAEQRLLRRLAVFAVGCTLSAAEAVCADDDLPRSAILDVLDRLAAKSAVLTQPGERAMRYRVLHTMRPGALERLAEAGELEHFRQRHLRWCIELAESRWRSEVDPTELAIGTESDEIAGALDWASQSDADADGLRLTIGSWPLWVFRGQAAEGQKWLSRFTSGYPANDARLRAQVACLEGGLTAALGDIETAIGQLGHGARLASECGDRRLEARALGLQGEMYLRYGDLRAARTALDAAARLASTSGAVYALARLSIACLEQDDLGAAREYARHALRLAEASGRHGLLARAWEVVGEVAVHEHARGRALAAFERALDEARRANRWEILASASLGLARVHLDSHELGRARSLVAQLATIAHHRSLSWLWPRMLETAAEIAAVENPTRSARLYGAASALRERSGRTSLPSETARRTRRSTRALHQLGSAWFESLRAGRLLDPDRALEQAGLVKRRTDGRPLYASRTRRLSVREQQVAQLIAQDLSNRAIAQALSLSEATIRLHVEHVLSKLGIHSRVQVGGRLGARPARRSTPASSTM